MSESSFSASAPSFVPQYAATVPNGLNHVNAYNQNNNNSNGAVPTNNLSYPSNTNYPSTMNTFNPSPFNGSNGLSMNGIAMNNAAAASRFPSANAINGLNAFSTPFTPASTPSNYQSSMPSSSPPGVCKMFLQQGSCKYGSACKYAHPASALNGMNGSTSNGMNGMSAMNGVNGASVNGMNVNHDQQQLLLQQLIANAKSTGNVSQNDLVAIMQMMSNNNAAATNGAVGNRMAMASMNAMNGINAPAAALNGQSRFWNDHQTATHDLNGYHHRQHGVGWMNHSNGYSNSFHGAMEDHRHLGGGAGGSMKYQHYFEDGRSNTERNAEMEQMLFSGHHSGINFESYEDIEVHVTGEDVPPPIQSFDELGFPEILQDNITLAKYLKPTPVQKNALPIALNGRDLMACAQTGSGKTCAYLFPLISHLIQMTMNHQWPVQSFNRRLSSPFGLILAPTRELATQIYDEAVKFTYRTGLHCVVVYGGVDAKIQYRELSAGGCDILVATPGRLIDFLDRGRISLQNLGYLVFDEADRMLDMGFEPQIRAIVQNYHMPTHRQTAMYSATFPKDIQRLASEFLSHYAFITIGRVGSTSELITQRVIQLEETQKRDQLLAELPNCDGLCLIFVATKKSADMLEAFLKQKKINAVSIHGDRSQGEREYALTQFKSQRSPILIATDVASRGLDIPNVRLVINYDLPTNIDDYVHRIGRTGRAGNTGTAISFYTDINSNVSNDLYDLLVESKQEIPEFLQRLVGDRRAAQRGAFGGKDFRSPNEYGRGRGRGGFRGGRGRGGGFGQNRGGFVPNRGGGFVQRGGRGGGAGFVPRGRGGMQFNQRPIDATNGPSPASFDTANVSTTSAPAPDAKW